MRIYLLLLLFAMAVTVVLTPLVRRLALAFNVLTPLRERDVHSVPTPRMGGIAMTAGFAFSLLLASKIPYFSSVFASSVVWTVLFGAIAFCVLGAIDDVWELDWMAKLAGQILITGVMAMNGVQLISFPIAGLTIGSSRLSILVSVLVMVTIVNAVNFIDGLDGLAAGIVAIGGLSFFAYSYLLIRMMDSASYATSAAVIMMALVGACLGFLWFNFHPASIFMGDSGAMVLGLVIASAGIIVTGQIRPTQLEANPFLTAVLPIMLPFVVILIPLVDLIVTALGRLFQGKSPFTADRTHLHDRLLDYGHSHRGVVGVLWLWSALACVVGVSLLLLPPVLVFIFGGIGILVLSIITWASFPGWRREGHKGSGVPGGKTLVDDGIQIISKPKIPLRENLQPSKLVNHPFPSTHSHKGRHVDAEKN